MAFLGNLQPEKSFGGRIGGDIADIIQGLAQNKAQNLKVKNNRDFLQGLGFHPQVAGPLSQQSDHQISSFLKQLDNFDVTNPPQPNYQNQNNQNQNYQNQQQNAPGMGQGQPNYQNQNLQNQQQNVPGMGQAQPVQSTLQGQSGQSQDQSAQQFNQPGQQQPRGIRSKGSSNKVDIGQTKQTEYAQENAKLLLEKGQWGEHALKVLNEYEAILKNEDISWGISTAAAGAIGAQYNLEEATQVLNKLSVQLIPPSRSDAELAVAKARVPSPLLSKGAQMRLVKSLRKDATEDIKKGRYAGQIMNQNGGIAPIGIDRMVGSKFGFKEAELSVNESPQGYSFNKQVKSLNDIKPPEGSQALDDNGKWYMYTNGKWSKKS